MAVPQSQSDFRIGIICASPVDTEMVQRSLDRTWDHKDINFDQVRGDKNTYILGVIRSQNVVLVSLRRKGASNAAMAAVGLRASFCNIRVAISVGRCGVIPRHVGAGTSEDIFLGDCIISTGVVQYDFGRQYPGAFVKKTGVEDTISRQHLTIRALVAKIQSEPNFERISTRTAIHLGHLQKLMPEAVYPGIHRDRLFDASYIHPHHDSSRSCEVCQNQPGICTRNCDTLGCQRVIRKRSVPGNNIDSSPLPRLHFGQFGSGSLVIESGVDRERIAKENNVIAFEMEGAGLQRNLPTIIVKAGSNYADSHKSKEWDMYAAATAAAATKAIIESLGTADVAL